MTPEEIERLAWAIKRKGPRWAKLLPPLRTAWARAKAGGEVGELAPRLAGALRLGTMALGTKCPQCPPPQVGTWAGSRTVLTLPDRYVSACSACGTEWVTKDRR